MYSQTISVLRRTRALEEAMEVGMQISRATAPLRCCAEGDSVDRLRADSEEIALLIAEGLEGDQPRRDRRVFLQRLRRAQQMRGRVAIRLYMLWGCDVIPYDTAIEVSAQLDSLGGTLYRLHEKVLADQADLEQQFGAAQR